MLLLVLRRRWLWYLAFIAFCFYYLHTAAPRIRTTHAGWELAHIETRGSDPDSPYVPFALPNDLRVMSCRVVSAVFPHLEIWDLVPRWR